MSSSHADDVKREVDAILARVNARRALATAARHAIAPRPEPARSAPSVGEPAKPSSAPASIARADSLRPAAPASGQGGLSTAQLEDLARRGDVTAKHPDLEFAPSVLHDRIRAVMLAVLDVTYREAYEIAAAAREGEDIKELAQRVDLARRGDPVARRPDARWAKSPVHDRARKLMLADPKKKLRYVEALVLTRQGDSRS